MSTTGTGQRISDGHGPDEGFGPVPEANRPGHHPEVEQDKPTGPPPVPRGAAPVAPPERFLFRFDPLLAPAQALLGVTRATAWASLDDRELVVRFGRWVVRTPVQNLAGATLTGPYHWWKVGGPPRLSLADRGLTFATNRGPGVCVRFHEPVTGLVPGGWVRHPSLTVTVADPLALVDAVADRGPG